MSVPYSEGKNRFTVNEGVDATSMRESWVRIPVRPTKDRMVVIPVAGW